jgi:hypothetical protein
MRPEGIVLFHVVFGMFGILAALWLYVEALNSSEVNQGRMRVAATLIPIFIWLSWIIGGYYYVKYYPASRAVILAGPLPWAHKFFMEIKEHLFFMVLWAATFVPFLVYQEKLLSDRGSRTLLLTVTAVIVILGLIMDGSGAIIIMGEKCGLQGR